MLVLLFGGLGSCSNNSDQSLSKNPQQEEIIAREESKEPKISAKHLYNIDVTEIVDECTCAQAVLLISRVIVEKSKDKTMEQLAKEPQDTVFNLKGKAIQRKCESLGFDPKNLIHCASHDTILMLQEQLMKNSKLRDKIK